MIELNPVRQRIADLTERLGSLRGYLDYDAKRERLEEVERELENPDIWNDPERAQNLGRERAQLDRTVNGIRDLTEGLNGASELLELAEMESDEDTANAVVADVERFARDVDKLEFQRMFSGEMDATNAFVDIQAGAGGTEAQDWAEILLRMYLRWAEGRGWKVELMEASAGEVAGIKSATFRVEGDYAYGWLKTEIGVHRLVRKSPFDSDNRRHTSFTSVFVSPEVDDNIDIEINPADLKTDVYRSSGAGGQHVNKTESAVRITHVPSGVVVACQTERSQHANRDRAMKMLKAKLYEIEIQKRNAEKNALEATKSDIGWGSQIRNYVLDQSRIKDLRTGVERSDTQKVLDGDLDEFLEASLKSGLDAGAKRVDA
ncbi:MULTISPECIES: peptide chain release factor 2 [Pseudoxanthomonas]|uniref:Peptide chain release factor 2 n=2 Tax=Pseudoxanthomonas winnipegensis TaxID=2480810 RepID=A0A4Q8M0F4_9GAMM|nr:peptide chain release factor 2 [Pseudoxanthomonas winnipegensis]RZZ87909.1 peptide chain release factor 2 [Pseudoxanthomonas winnipegensis]RZZ90359.1 peptide chain release factor 2 [Pseudoxanthomonas winnipegensis]TAA30046.1 peptide chain release factor 2 [Pseudoxanthomonas winnipegensis]TAA36570.1 peptide chain release factor 2 [Pseudoxanthomonas winnipegensis]TAA37484.1 peptide chain release factor 2 [Pseudoxanthomonas winnipegensis]